MLYISDQIAFLKKHVSFTFWLLAVLAISMVLAQQQQAKDYKVTRTNQVVGTNASFMALDYLHNDLKKVSTT